MEPMCLTFLRFIPPQAPFLRLFCFYPPTPFFFLRLSYLYSAFHRKQLNPCRRDAPGRREQGTRILSSSAVLQGVFSIKGSALLARPGPIGNTRPS